MRLHKKKIWASILISVFILSLTTGAFANNSFYENITTEKLSKGVSQSHIQRFNQDGWLNVNVLYVDLKDETVSLDLLQSAGGVTTKETLSTMAKSQENLVGAINGDFFYLLNPDSPMGIMAKDGKIISSPVINNKLGTLYVDKSNNAFADYLDYEINLKSDKGKIYKVAAINKVTSKYQFITVIDRNWGTHSPGVAEDRPNMVEIVVIDNQVTEVRKGLPAIDIPENGYIVMASGTWGITLANNIKVGDVLSIDTEITPGLENIKLALGGGTLLLSNGQVVPFTQTVTGNHPRTAVGISKDRSQLILVTIDGRHNSYPGVSGDRLAKLMIELGSHEAVIMDGGGSTTMVSRGLGSFTPKITNNPSEGTERRIINGLAVLSNMPAGNLYGIKVEANNANVFKDTSLGIHVKAYDNNFNPLTVDASKINYSLKTGSGSFNGNNFIPNRSGNAIIVVEYLGKTAEVSVRVLEEPANLLVHPKTLLLSPGKSTSLWVVGVDALGYRAPINIKDITWSDTKGLGTIKDRFYTAGNANGQTILEAQYKNTSFQVPVAIGNQQVILDNFNEMKVSFNSFPQEVTGSIQLVPNGRLDTNALALEYDFSNGSGTRAAYMDYPNGGIAINGNVTGVGVWVNTTEESTAWIRGRVYDAKGTAHVIDFKKGIDWIGWNYLEAPIPSNITYPIKIDRLYVVETNVDQRLKGKLIFDDLQVITSTVATTPLEVKNNIKDPLYGQATTKGTIFTAHGGMQLGKTLFDRYVSNNAINRINSESSMAIFTGPVDEDFRKQLKKPFLLAGGGHSHQDNTDHLIIQLDNSKRGIRTTNFTQWPYLKTQLQNTNKNNIFIVLPNPIWGQNGFTDGMEANLLADMLTAEAEKGKNIFVLYGGEEVTVNLRNGVRYIATGTHEQKKSQNDSSKAYQFLEFNVTGNSVTYEIKSVF